tara:strand:- start:19751 stop:20971 length:1221 start_codon:yes stop_codon:yes gene_type:complete
MAEKILIVSPIALIPYHSGNRKRIRTVCSELMKMGYELDFFYTGFDDNIDPQHDLFFNGRVLQYQTGNDKTSLTENPFLRISEVKNGIKIKWQKLLRGIFDSFDSARYNKSLAEYKNIRKYRLLQSEIFDVKYKAVIINYSVYSFYFKLFDQHTKKILDTHDCLTNRYRLFLKNGKIPIEWYSLRYHDEKRAVSMSDIVWAITAEEKNHYMGMLKNRSIEVLNLRHLVPFRHIPSNGPKKRVLLIGSDNRLNVDGLHWFTNQVWPYVYSKNPDSELMVAGSICNSKDEFKQDTGITFYGRYENEDEIYSMADICINPMQDGTGLKIKTLEALAHGKWVISTFEGGAGLNDMIGKGLYCSDDPKEWIESLNNSFVEKNDTVQRIAKTKKAIEQIYSDNLKIIDQSLK